MADPIHLFTGIHNPLAQEQFDVLLESGSVRIERIISQGHVTPQDTWLDQQEHEWIIVLKGEAQLLFEDDPRIIEMKPGDSLNIAAHRRHRVHWTTPLEPTVWLAVFHSD